MKSNQKHMSQRSVWVIATVVAGLLFTLGVTLAKIMLKDDGHKRERQIQMVTLLKLPPPPKMEKLPPPPEVEKEEEVVEEQEEAPADEPANDSTPDALLGLDAEGGAGSDSFGLAARKGGKGLIGGTGTNPYAWYSGRIVTKLQKLVNEIMRRHGKAADDREALVRIVLDDRGYVTDSSILRSSGDSGMDEAVLEAIQQLEIDEPPPIGMSKAMRFKVSSTG